MTIIVVGGHSRNIGKTSVTAGLICAFRSCAWTAVKISSHSQANDPHLLHLRNGDSCGLYEETKRDGSSDTSRFLVAGASRAFWMRVVSGSPEDPLKPLQRLLDSSPFLIIESNWILRYLQPDLCLMVLRYDVGDFKESARQALGRANAIVAVNAGSSPPLWSSIAGIPAEIPQFSTADPQILPAGLIDFVRLRLPQTDL